MINEIKERIELISRGEVPKGYKKTDVGIVPVEWESKKLKDIGKFSKGKGLPGSEMTNQGVPCVGYGDIYTKYNLCFDKAHNFVSQDIANQSVPVSKGSLLFTSSGETQIEIGKCICYIGNEPIYVGGDIEILELNKTLNGLFVGYQQNIFSSIKQKARYGQGNSVVHIYSNSLGRLGVAYPENIEEQEKIANILLNWDKAICLQEELIKKLELQKKALMQKLLTPKKDWQTVKIGNLTKELSIRNKNNACQNIKSVSNRFGFINQDEQFSKQVASLDMSKYKIVKCNDIAYNPSRINVGSIAIYEDIDIGIISPMYVVFECIGITPKLLLLLLDTNKGKYDIKSFLTGSVRDTLNYDDLSNIVIKLPNDKQCSKILELFNALESNIATATKKLKKLKQQQKSMQQLLLTGIVRVN
ncbi:MAG: restriction endonuclease subunit S [Dysgonomonas sp.]